jgi:hypothetical protein
MGYNQRTNQFPNSMALQVQFGQREGQSLNVPLAPKKGLVVQEQLARGHASEGMEVS